jgi:penicillin amidase
LPRRRRFAARSDFNTQSRPRRQWVRGVLLSALGLIPLLGFLVFGLLWLTVPPDNQTLRIPGLSAPVEVIFDSNGVPRIAAANERDAAAALGYVHARDRMFQMELMRRAASGRLSELVGPATLAIDKQMRVFGLARLAEGDLAAQSPETRGLLDAYAAGVNAWIASRGRFAALEFLFFGAPEPWRPVDSLLWGRTMSLWLSTNYRTELGRQALRDKVPIRELEQLWPSPPAPLPPQASLTDRGERDARLPSNPVARDLQEFASGDPPEFASRHPPEFASRHPPEFASRHPSARPGDQSTHIPGLGDGPLKPHMHQDQPSHGVGMALSASCSGLTRASVAPGILGNSARCTLMEILGSSPRMTTEGKSAALDAYLDAYAVKPGHDGTPDDRAAAEVLAALPTFPAPFTLPSTASDAWAVDGRWTDTGAPMLAGDPHLSFDFPSLWYLVRIETPGHLLVGATGPGAPFLVLGHNGQIAWTFTTTGADTQDVWLEPTDVAFITRQERIKVRGQPDTLLTVRETRHGPVISDLKPGDGPIMAVGMANLLPRDTGATGLLALDHARTVEEAGKAAPLIASPVQNLMVADRSKIGLFVTGRVPIRRAGDGWAPMPGSAAPSSSGQVKMPTGQSPSEQTQAPPASSVQGPSGATAAAQGAPAEDDDPYGWVGFASGDALPHIVAPSSGRLVNSNEPVWPPDFPVFMGRDTYTDWRARRIRTLLDAAPKQSTSDFAAMQVDVISTYAAALLPTLRVVPGAPQVLRDWDGAMTENAPQPLIFSVWMDTFHHAVLAKAGIPIWGSAPVFEFVPFVLSPQGKEWCGGDCMPLLKSTLDSTMSSLTSRFGSDPATWRWGAVHQAVFAHPILRSVPVLGALTTERIAVPGDGTTLDRGGTNDALEAVHGASYRGVYDLADLERSLFMMTPGQSGNPLSWHARDFLTRWRDGAMVLLAHKPVEVSGTVRLVP